jgi:hypothetical protein
MIRILWFAVPLGFIVWGLAIVGLLYLIGALP